MYLCPKYKVLFSTDNLTLFEKVMQLYTDDISKEMVNGYYSGVLSKPNISDENITRRKGYFDDIDLSKEIDLKILVVTQDGHCYSSKEFSDYDVLITISSFPYMNMALEVNPKLRVFCVKHFSDCQAFTKMLFMTFASDNIIDIDFYDVNMAFGMTATKPRVIKHFSYDDAKVVTGCFDSALVYVYTNEKDLFELTSIYKKYSTLDISNMMFLACSGNKAVQEEEGVFLSSEEPQVVMSKQNVVIREYKPSDCKEIAGLFYNTVHSINAIDYSTEQLDAWASGKVNLQKWNDSFIEHYTLVAIENDTLLGFGDIDSTGYLDRLYVHKDYQGRGIASALLEALEKSVDGNLVTVHVSKTAKAFFKQKGYIVVEDCAAVRNGIKLPYSIMVKKFVFPDNSKEEEYYKQSRLYSEKFLTKVLDEEERRFWNDHFERLEISKRKYDPYREFEPQGLDGGFREEERERHAETKRAINEFNLRFKVKDKSSN